MLWLEQGFIFVFGDCIRCDSVQWGRLVGLFLAGLVAMLGFHKISQAVNPLAKMFFYFGEPFSRFLRKQVLALSCLAARELSAVRVRSRALHYATASCALTVDPVAI